MSSNLIFREKIKCIGDTFDCILVTSNEVTREENMINIKLHWLQVGYLTDIVGSHIK